jgi:molybdate transport system ATP-binding protein
MLELEVRAALGALAVDVALRVDAGETLAVVGPSGAGKTTLLRIVAGLLRPLEGRVVCEGQTWLDTGSGLDLPAERRRAGYLFQDYALFPNLCAWQNVAYGMPRVSRAERRDRALGLLERFGMEAHADAMPGRLSGGERQRVALARALARDPLVLLLDEPLSALDASTRAGAERELVSLLGAAGVPALLVTHDFAEAALLADRVAVIDSGRLVQSGKAAELSAAPASAFVADLTGAVVLTGTARPGERGLTTIELDGGGTLTSTDAADGPVAVTVHPWEITLLRSSDAPAGSAQNRLPATVTSVTPLGNTVRVGLQAPQPLFAEVTGLAVSGLELAPGASAVAEWKATATRLVALG